MKTTLTHDTMNTLTSRLKDANLAFAARYPGESERRQPVHTVYGGAHIFKADTTRKLGALGQKALDQYAPDAAVFARATGLTADLAPTIYTRVVEKLKREPVEDFRIDFEDGYGNRPDAEEDAHAAAAAIEVAKGMAEGSLPPFIGIRIKTFTEELRDRSMRTLDIFLSTLAAETRGAQNTTAASGSPVSGSGESGRGVTPGGVLPANFVVTLPKVTIPEQVAALAAMFDKLEPALGIAPGALKLEIMVETTQSIFNARGEITLPSLVDAAKGRCSAAHFGTYDYTASCNITAAHQHMEHPSCDFAKEVMQVSLAGTGVWLSDGATTLMPLAPHKAGPNGALTPEQTAENQAAVHRAWKLHFANAQHSLVHGFYQGWDLHPAQLPTRYAAVYSFFLSGLKPATERLKNFIQKAAQATLVGDVFDDAATGQGLLNYFLRGVNCSALTEAEALVTGVTLDELRGRSFVKILKNRRK